MTRSIIPAAPGFYWLTLDERGHSWRFPVLAWASTVTVDDDDTQDLTCDNVFLQAMTAEGPVEFYPGVGVHSALEAPDGTVSDTCRNWDDRQDWLSYWRRLDAAEKAGAR